MTRNKQKQFLNIFGDFQESREESGESACHTITGLIRKMYTCNLTHTHAETDRNMYLFFGHINIFFITKSL